MKALVFGMGLQGKAVVHDLENSGLVDKIVVADQQLDLVKAYLNRKGYSKTSAVNVDASSESELREEHGHLVDIPGFGSLEAYPNGDAVHYIDLFKLEK